METVKKTGTTERRSITKNRQCYQCFSNGLLGALLTGVAVVDSASSLWLPDKNRRYASTTENPDNTGNQCATNESQGILRYPNPARRKETHNASADQYYLSTSRPRLCDVRPTFIRLPRWSGRTGGPATAPRRPQGRDAIPNWQVNFSAEWLAMAAARYRAEPGQFGEQPSSGHPPDRPAAEDAPGAGQVGPMLEIVKGRTGCSRLEGGSAPIHRRAGAGLACWPASSTAGQ